MNKQKIDKVNKVVSWFFTFVFVNLAWVIFRSTSILQAKSVFLQLLSGGVGVLNSDMMEIGRESITEFWAISSVTSGTIAIALLYLFGICACLYMKNTNDRIVNLKICARNSIISSILFIWSISSFVGVSTFLYFNF